MTLHKDEMEELIESADGKIVQIIKNLKKI